MFLGVASCTRKRKRDILLGTWNVRSLYRSGAFKAAARELTRYKLDLVGVQEVRWKRGEPYEQGTVISSMKRNSKSSAGNRIFVNQRITSPVKRVEFVSDRMSYIVL